MVLLCHQGWDRSNLCDTGTAVTKEKAGGDQVAIWQHLALHQGTDLPFLNSRLECFLLHSEITTST